MSGRSSVHVMAAGRPVVLRPGAFPGGLGTGLEDATAQIQALIDLTPVNGTLELPRGTYLVSKPIVISKPMTLTTRGSSGLRQSADPLAGGSLDLAGYATLKASPSLVFGFFYPPRDQDKGLLIVRPPEGQDTLSGVHIRHIALDGNGVNRGTDRFSNDQMNCSNLNMRRTDNSSFTDSVSFHAVGRGWDPYAHIFVDCTNLKIDDNLLLENGESSIGPSGPEYNGSNFATNTLEVRAETRDVRVEIKRNRVYDSTILGIVVQTSAGRTMTGEVAYNVIRQFRSMSYGVGLELYGDGSFGNGRLQNPRTTLLVHHNLIDGNAGAATIPGTSTRLRQIPYGLMIGVGPFGNPPENGVDVQAWQIKGGRIYRNEIRNVQVGVNVDQAGTVASPTYVLDNTVGGSTGLAFNKAPQNLPGYPLNVIVTNQSTVRDRQGKVRQTGKAKLFADNQRPASWSDLFTRGSVGGTQEPFRRLIAAAPKPFQGPQRGQGRPN
ncbi:hypothetical protein P12x_002975 [Tundrisphaera lichenicola]|uniref:hypothetical protein n=1 Tax=Tundrisphaera lichenicola TaxID=2029860 RepID=UPI003EBB150C